MLLYFLFCNLFNILLYINNWGNVFSFRDRSVLVNIERICLIRNEFGYSLEIFILEIDFNNKW